MTDIRADIPDPAETVIGTTPLTPRGYFVRVAHVFFPTGLRVRMTLLRDVGGVTVHVRDLDITRTLARSLIPLLKKAVDE
jgi:hypothetical protein